MILKQVVMFVRGCRKLGSYKTGFDGWNDGDTA